MTLKEQQGKGRGNVSAVTGAMTRKSFIRIASAGLAGILWSGCAPGIISRGRKHNLLYITIDTLRADHLGCYGYCRNTSPNIDNFAKNGILFTNFFTDVPKTAPSMTSVFTGKYVQNHGVTSNDIKWSKSLRGLPEYLPENYRKAAFVMNGYLGRSNGFHGFDRGNHIPVTQQAIDKLPYQWLDLFADDSGFFLWLHYLDPHGPYRPEGEFNGIFLNDPYCDLSEKVPLDYEPREGFNKHYVLGAIPKYIREGDRDEKGYYIAQYDAEIRYTDSVVGKVLDYVASKKCCDRTIIIISADHGESLGEDNYYFEHGMLVNEATIHIPLIISHPEITEPLVVASLLQNADLFPTILSEFGVKTPDDIDGIDFSELYKKRQAHLEKREYIYSRSASDYWDLHESIRDRNRKLVRKNGGEEIKLYDLANGRMNVKQEIPSSDMKMVKTYTGIMDAIGKHAMAAGAEVNLPPDLKESLKALGYIN